MHLEAEEMKAQLRRLEADNAELVALRQRNALLEKEVGELRSHLARLNTPGAYKTRPAG